MISTPPFITERCQVSKHCLKVAQNKFQSVTNCFPVFMLSMFPPLINFLEFHEIFFYNFTDDFQGKFQKKWKIETSDLYEKSCSSSLQIVVADHHNGTLLTQNGWNLRER